MKVHCLFEQSGTFKNEFKKLGYEAYDYAHMGDYCGFDEMFGFGHGRKYTTRELVGDCISAIDDWIDQ